MLGIVGKVKITYCVDEHTHIESYDLVNAEEIRLKGIEGVVFRVEEVIYIEDTVYGATLSMIEPKQLLDEFSIGSYNASFEIPELNLYGSMELSFLNK